MKLLILFEGRRRRVLEQILASPTMAASSPELEALLHLVCERRLSFHFASHPPPLFGRYVRLSNGRSYVVMNKLETLSSPQWEGNGMEWKRGCSWFLTLRLIIEVAGCLRIGILVRFLFCSGVSKFQ